MKEQSCGSLFIILGHFGRGPVRISWLLIVFPSVLANYLGQGALIMMQPSLANSPFYNLSPTWFRWPLIILSTLATGKSFDLSSLDRLD